MLLRSEAENLSYSYCYDSSMEKYRREKYDRFLSVLQLVLGLNLCTITVLIVLVGVRNSTETVSNITEDNTQKFTEQQKFKGT